MAKPTRSQRQILALLDRLNRPVSAREIYDHLSQESRIGIATVYRALEVLRRQGTIKVGVRANGEAAYSPLPLDRHYLHCLHCGCDIPLESCPLAPLAPLAKTIPFTVYYHTLEFFGVCGPCQAKTSS
ncbi:MAG: transcriptional repressor [Oscillatoriales cyanobacterium SM2_1_8]|nr:transcriptional repressor [Oscillatoriales cyanobacterium SM2_1_8]